MQGGGKLNKQQYAEQYDRVAKGLYRFALYLLGDAAEARRALAEAFAEGWAFAYDAPFEQRMMKTVWRCSLRCIPAREDRYVQALCAAARRGQSQTNLRLFETLGRMEQTQRALLLLCFLQGLDSRRAAWVLDADARQAEAMLRELCSDICLQMPA
jgi:DNA-directed RNA polymerase specialized sigma24 family protein